MVRNGKQQQRALISKSAGFLKTRNKINRSVPTQQPSSPARCHSSAWARIHTEGMQPGGLWAPPFIALGFHTYLQVLFGGVRAFATLPSTLLWVSPPPPDGSPGTGALPGAPSTFHHLNATKKRLSPCPPPTPSLATPKLLQAGEGNASLPTH